MGDLESEATTVLGSLLKRGGPGGDSSSGLFLVTLAENPDFNNLGKEFSAFLKRLLLVQINNNEVKVRILQDNLPLDHLRREGLAISKENFKTPTNIII